MHISGAQSFECKVQGKVELLSSFCNILSLLMSFVGSQSSSDSCNFFKAEDGVEENNESKGDVVMESVNSLEIAIAKMDKTIFALREDIIALKEDVCIK